MRLRLAAMDYREAFKNRWWHVSIRLGRLWFLNGRFYWRRVVSTANGKYKMVSWGTPTWR